MICSFTYGTQVLSLPAATLSALAEADKLCLCVLLHAAKEAHDSMESLARAVRESGIACNEAQAQAALAYWERAGILTVGEGVASAQAREAAAKRRILASELPVYDGAEIAEKLTQNESRIAFLLEDCQRILQRTLSPTEISRLVALCDFCGIECKYLRLIFTYCASLGKRTFGYAEKMARNLFSEGIETVEALEIYISQKQEQKKLEAIVRSIGGLGARALTKKEESLLAEWTRAAYAEELLRLAYDICVNNTGKVSLPYMNTILVDWHQQGLHTVEQVQAAKEAKAEGEQSFDTDEFFERALKRSYQSLQQTEEQS